MQLRFYRGVWCAYERVIKDGKSLPVRTSLRTTDRAEAERRLLDLIAHAQGPQVLVEDIFPRYLADKLGTGGHKSTGMNWKRLGPFFGHLRPDQINRAVCREYIAKRLADGVGNNTIHRELGILRAALNWADKKTPAEIELPPKPPPRDRYLSKAEFRALLGATSSPHVRLFVILALSTAGRASALLELRWDQVDFDRGIIRLSKAGAERLKGRATVPMTSMARRALLIAKKASLSDHVIEYAGGPIKSISKSIERTSARAGLKNVTPHVLRHTAAVWMAEDRVPMTEIAQFLGHTNSRVTERVYARYSPEYLRNAASALELDI